MDTPIKNWSESDSEISAVIRFLHAEGKPLT